MRRREKQEARHRLARTVGMFVILLTLSIFYLYMSLTWNGSSSPSVDVDTDAIESKAEKFALKQKKPKSRGEPNVLHADFVEARAKRRQKKQFMRERGIENEEVMLCIS